MGMDEKELERSVGEALAEDALVEAYDLLRQAEDVYADRATYIRLREEVESRLRVELSRRFQDLTVHPTRLRPAVDIRSYRLTSFDVYVLGLFDGVTSLADALALSLKQELQTLRSVAKLTDLGLLDPANHLQ